MADGLRKYMLPLFPVDNLTDRRGVNAYSPGDGVLILTSLSSLANLAHKVIGQPSPVVPFATADALGMLTQSGAVTKGTTALRRGVSRIVGVRAEPEMRRVTALTITGVTGRVAIVAGVTDTETIRNRTGGENPRPSGRGLSWLPLHVEVSIAVASVDASKPGPASIRTTRTVNLGPKAGRVKGLGVGSLVSEVTGPAAKGALESAGGNIKSSATAFADTLPAGVGRGIIRAHRKIAPFGVTPGGATNTARAFLRPHYTTPTAVIQLITQLALDGVDLSTAKLREVG